MLDGVETARYAFDGNSNRLSRTTPAGVAAGTYDAQDRMLTYGGCSYTHNANGDTERQTCGSSITQYRYDIFGNLRSAQLPDGRTIEYLIDGAQRRIGKLVNGTLVQRLVYQNQLEPVAELNPDGSLKQLFVYADKAHVPTLIIRRESGSDVAYRVVSDYLGSVRLVIKLSDGQVVQRINYDEYGVVLSDSNPGFQPFGYAGGIDDRDVGLVRFGARDYLASAGRWMTKDVLRHQSDDLNFYSYAISDPINNVDISGFINWVKVGTGTLNAMNSGRKAASAAVTGLAGAGLGGPTNPVGALALAKAAWDAKSAMAAFNRAKKILGEAFCEDMDYGGGDEVRRRGEIVKALAGLLPYGDLADDPHEPYWEDVMKEKARDFRNHPIEFLGEIGTAF